MDSSASASELERLREELGDQYAIVRLIGRGGMGAVYLARELSRDRVAARRARPITTLVALDPDSIVVSMGPIAVTGLTDPEWEGLGEGVAVMVAIELGQALRMVDRTDLPALVDALVGGEGQGAEGIAGFEGAPEYETAVNQADRFYESYEAAMAGTLGQIVPETHIVYGSVGVSGDRVLVGLWMVSVDEAAVVGFAQAEGMREGLYEALIQATRTLLDGLVLGR